MMTRLIVLMTIATSVYSQPLPDYYTRNQFLFTSPGVFNEGLLGFTNPANLTMLHNSEMRFIWSSNGRNALSLQNWGVFAGFPHFGFAVQRQKFSGVGVTDFRLSTGGGSRAVSFGLAYGWSAGKLDALGREKLFSTGTLWRPARFLSLGLIGNFSLESSHREGVAEIGIRPLGNSRLTLFADAALRKGTAVSDAPWSVGAVLQVVDGLHLTGRYFNFTDADEKVTIGLSVSFGRSSVAAQTHLSNGSDLDFTTYQIRMGGMRPSAILTGIEKDKGYVPIKMQGTVDYLKYKLFDEDTKRLYEILRDIEAAVNDPRISVIALNLSGMQVSPEHAWEIREELATARETGTQIIIFMDTGNLTSYHLASVADYLVLDPQGSLQLPGYALSKTYFKGTLEKLGLGFDEWRFFEYKSAAETLSRESMSEADSTQLQQFVDDWYELTRSEVCAARDLDETEFDRIVDDEGYILPEQALELGLVDTLARWSGVDGIIADVIGQPKKQISAEDLYGNALPPDNWGEPPKIAVVYGLGVCEMDDGIRARWLEGVLRSLGSDHSVKAVVFRVDSPGGDGMASDVVAEALKACSENKPVIVSQGQVAGSGGYWISMYGDVIVAGPNTITGSIGVIGGWIYDKGFGQKLGMSSDWVKRGKHADLGEGVTIPGLDIEVPARNLTDEEKKVMQETIEQLYATFVGKVATGRDMTVAEVEQIAEGRIYSGTGGQEIGLVDEIGGLRDAIEIARNMAGLTADEEIKIIEIPENKGWFDLREQFTPMPFQARKESIPEFIRLLNQHRGRPTAIMIPGTYPETK